MTLADQENPRTTTDLLFGPGADASDALARQILPANANLDHALKHLPQPTRDATVHEAADQGRAADRHPRRDMRYHRHPELPGYRHDHHAHPPRPPRPRQARHGNPAPA